MFQVPFLCTVTQIQIENITVTLTYIAAANFKILNNELDCCNTEQQIENLQIFHYKLCKFCKRIERSFGLNVTISVFTVLTQLLLMTFFETTLNIRPIKRNLMMDLYLVLNILYALVNIARIAVICKGCDLIHDQYKETGLKLEILSLICERGCADFTAQVQILKFRFAGCNLFYITMELVTEV